MNFKGFAISTDGFYHDSPVILGAKTLGKEYIKLPIDGLTEIDRPPRQGMIRLGVKKKTQGGKEYPAEVDYFILDPETPEPAEKARVIELFHAEFGNEPKAINCLIRSSDINEAFPQNYKRYGRNTALKCIGDGQTALCTDPQFVAGLKELTVEELAELQEIDVSKVEKDPEKPIVHCGGRKCMYSIVNEESKNKECKATATLSIEIPVLGGIGCWQITTGSFNSILNINGFIRDMIGRFGRAHMLPLTLERRQIETIFRGKKATHYPLYLNTHHSMAEMIRKLRIAPERFLIETYAEQAGELPPPAEIMDAEVSEPLMINCPPVNHDLEDPEQFEIDRLAQADKANEVIEKADKVLDAFGGSPADRQSAEFLEGLKKEAEVLNGPYDATVEGEGYKKACAAERETTAAPMPTSVDSTPNSKFASWPENFFEFMNKAKALLKKDGKEEKYIEALESYSVRGLTETKDDPKKQGDIRVYVESLLEEEKLV